MIYFVIGPARSGKSEFLRNITKNIVFDFWDANIKLRNGEKIIAFDDFMPNDTKNIEFIKQFHTEKEVTIQRPYYNGKKINPNEITIFVSIHSDSLNDFNDSFLEIGKPIYLKKNVRKEKTLRNGKEVVVYER